MRKCSFWAYANSKVPDQPANLIRDFGIYMYMYIDTYYIIQGFCKRTAKHLFKLSGCAVFWAFALFL